LSGENVWATTLAYGVNSGREIIPGDAIDLVTHALMLESSMTFRERQTWFGRAELVGKPAHDLHAHEYPTRVFAVGKLEAGYVRNFKTWNSIVPGIGGAFSLSIVPSELAPRYTSQVRPGFAVFVTIRPARHVM
jgi:acyl-ACP thioesterase